MRRLKRDKQGRLLFTKQMKKEYTVLIPMMAPFHFTLIKNVLKNAGYHAELLTNCSYNVVQEGLKYVHNDTCYPALLVIGQMIDALGSGRYDLDRTALIITQTGGGCRASNYIYLLRKALKKAGYENIPVISLNLAGLEHNSGFRITLPLIRRLIAALVYGDLLMLLNNQVKAYEVEKGRSATVVERWIQELTGQFARGRGMSMRAVRANMERIATDFAQVPVRRVPKVRVGVVGEIFVKYASLANNGLEDFLASQDCEVMVPGILGFILYCVENREQDYKLYGGGALIPRLAKVLENYLVKMEGVLLETVGRHPGFTKPMPFSRMEALAADVISLGVKMGEGWLLTGEMAELIEHGFSNIVCTQPFGCLPNHVCGKGMIHKLKEKYPDSNIVAIDYDPSATKVNQENRIKLMLAVAREQLAQAQEAKSEKETEPVLPHR